MMNEPSELSAYPSHTLIPDFLHHWHEDTACGMDPVVLLVSADRKVLNLMQREAARRGLACDIVESLGEARRFMTSTSYDIVFLDTTMQEQSLVEILKKHRSFPPRSLVIAESAAQEAKKALELLRSSVPGELLAPVTPDSMVLGLELAVAAWRSRIYGVRYRARLEETLRSRTQTLLRAMKEIDRLHEVSVQAIASTLDMRLPETAEHGKRVAESSALIGDSLGLSAIGLRDLRWGARLHDIGKIAVPDLILAKPGALTEEELLIVRAHTVRGSEMLSGIPFLSGAREAVLSHHERYDGTGYPHGLYGEQIPLAARIVAVADAFDAMSHERPYHRALSPRTVIAQLEREAGSHYDPKVVASFLRFQSESWRAQAPEMRYWSTDCTS